MTIDYSDSDSESLDEANESLEDEDLVHVGKEVLSESIDGPDTCETHGLVV